MRDPMKRSTALDQEWTRLLSQYRKATTAKARRVTASVLGTKAWELISAYYGTLSFSDVSAEAAELRVGSVHAEDVRSPNRCLTCGVVEIGAHPIYHPEVYLG